MKKSHKDLLFLVKLGSICVVRNNLNTQNDHFVSVVALCAHFNLSLMVRYICIGPVHETGKKLAIALMRRLADLNLIIYTLYQ